MNNQLQYLHIIPQYNGWSLKTDDFRVLSDRANLCHHPDQTFTTVFLLRKDDVLLLFGSLDFNAAQTTEDNEC